jgi:ferredoxin
MDNYMKLREILHNHPTGAPESKAFDEILRILFTPEEVEVTLGMIFVPRTVTEIAEASGISEQGVQECCESMANKGIIFARQKDGEMGYALSPTVPGIFEFPLMRGGGTPMHSRLGQLWHEYYRESLGDELTGSETPLGRVIPIRQTLPVRLEILPYEVVSGILNTIETFALAQCACRVSANACDKPREVCLFFDKTAEFLIDRNLARKATRSEAEDAIRRSEEAGLVHTTNNAQTRLTFLCNCCPCCCFILKGVTQLGKPNAVAKSRWYAKVDTGLCNGCGVCENERCPIGAAKVDEGVARVDPVRCLGCGLCSTTCETKAISLIPREIVTEPAATVPDLAVRIAAEKGRLEKFVEFVKR